MKIFRPLAVLTVLILLLIVVGGMVRNLGAGLSCPDWPLCKGKIIPELDLRVFAEYFHRLFAAAVSILTLILSFLIFTKPDLRSKFSKPMALGLALLFSQVILGGLTVLKLLQSEIVTLHLATGTLFFATVLFMTLRARNIEASVPPNKSLLLWSKISCLAVYLQIILGGVVSSHYAGLACPDFPTCLGSWWPGALADSNVHIQFAHRLGAFTVFTIVVIFAAKLFTSKKHPVKALLITFFLLFQIALGIANVIWRLPIALSVGHLAIAECLFAMVLISAYEIRHFKLS